jgi:ABC-type phosphate transport system auxiliary subunit
MFTRLYYAAALALLPTTEAVVTKFEHLVKKLDTVTVHLEGYLAEQAVVLAQNSHSRRSTIDSLKAKFAKLIAAAESAFDRRERAVIDDINAIRAKLDKASQVRDSVENFLENLGR